MTAWHTYLSRGPRLWNPFLLAMSLAKAGGSGCPEMNTIVNITSFIIQPNSLLHNRQTNQHSNSMQQLSQENDVNQDSGLPCEGSRCTRKWFVKTSFAETLVGGRRRRAESKVRRKMER